MIKGVIMYARDQLIQYSVWQEVTLRQYIWATLENKLHLDVFGEVPLTFERTDAKKENIKVDLIGVSKNVSKSDYYGFEVKLKPDPTAGNFLWGRKRARQSKAKRRRNLTALQLSRMASSGYFDYCYLCCLENEVPYIPSESRDFIKSMASYSVYELICKFYPDYNKVGILAFNTQGSLVNEPLKAIRLERIRIPKLPRDNEGFVRHHVFSKLNETFGTHRICEGILPNKEKGKPLRIDILCFKGSEDPSTILKNQDLEGYDLIGIESKGKNFNVRQAEKELKEYIASGGLTRLYFAFPEISMDKALKLKKEISEIGLISVNEDGCIKLIAEAPKIRMRYDAIKFNVGLDEFFGYVTERKMKRDVIVNIGWGMLKEDYISLFDQTV